MCRTVDLRQAVLARNDEHADALRRDLARRGTVEVNLLSSPGSGKTALLELLLARAVRDGLPVAAITADLATENDARRLARAGAPVKQVLTDGLCHLEAGMLRGRLEGWLPEGTRLLMVENVGNLVCPASYDLGETLRVVLASVTEGEDKPLKYPTAFGLANLVVITKTDLERPAGFDGATFRHNVERVNPGVPVLRTSARTGYGVDALHGLLCATADGAPVHVPVLAHHHADHTHGPADHTRAPGDHAHGPVGLATAEGPKAAGTARASGTTAATGTGDTAPDSPTEAAPATDTGFGTRDRTATGATAEPEAADGPGATRFATGRNDRPTPASASPPPGPPGSRR